MEEERRLEPRIAVSPAAESDNAPLQDMEDCRETGTVINISKTGMRLESLSPVTVSQVILVVPGLKGERIEIAGNVVYSRTCEDCDVIGEAVYEIGIQFSGEQETIEARIFSFMRALNRGHNSVGIKYDSP